MRGLYSGQFGIWRDCFCGGRKTGVPAEFYGEELSEYGENQQLTRPTALGRTRPQATMVGGERSPALRHQ